MLQELVACVVVSLTSSAILAGGILGVGVGSTRLAAAPEG